MPSFPGSVWSPTTKNTDEVIQAAHINDLQDEVVAIQAGYINGTAPLVSSRITAPPPDCVVAYRDSTFTIGADLSSTITFNAQRFATNSSMHSTTTNTDRITPQTTGLYLIQGQVQIIADTNGSRTLSLVDSSGLNLALAGFGVSPVAGAGIAINVSAFKRYDVTGGFCRMIFSQTQTSTLSLTSGATQFGMAKLV